MSMIVTNDVWTLTFPLAKIEGDVELSFHQAPHVDELVGALAIIEEATDEFLERYGRTIRLGHGGGPFDEHRRGGQERQEGQCCATLVAQALGLLEDSAWKRLFRYAYFTDVGKPLGGGKPGSFEVRSPFDLTNLSKLTWRDNVTTLRNPSDEQRCETVLGFLRYLQLFLWKQQKFLAAQEEIFFTGRIEEIARGRKRPLRVLFIQSDNYETNAAGRAQGADVVMQHHTSSGNCNVYTANTSKVDLTDFVVSLHVREMQLAEVKRIPDWLDLRKDGMPEGSCWYFTSMHQQVHNGTEHHNVPPSKIPLEEREELLLQALDPNYFEPSRAEECRGGLCWHSRNTPCPIFERGYQRCRQIRYEMKMAAQTASS